MKISHKLFASAGVMVLLLTVIGLYSSYSMGTTREHVDEINHELMRSILLLGEVEVSQVEMTMATSNHLNATTPQEQAQHEQEIATLEKTIKESMLAILPLIAEAEEKAKAEQANGQLADYFRARDKVLALSREGRKDEGRTFFESDLIKSHEGSDAAVMDLKHLNEKEAEALGSQVSSMAGTAKALMMGAVLLGLLAGVGVALYLGQNIGGRLGQVVKVLEGVAEGDYNQRMSDHSSDEVGRMGAALDRALDDIKAKVDALLSVVKAAAQGDLTREVTVAGHDPLGQMGEGLASFMATLNASLQNIGDNATQLSSAAEESGAASQQISANAEETSAQAQSVSSAAEQANKSVQTVAASAEEMQASIKEIAHNSAQAAQIASSAVNVLVTTNAKVSHLAQSSLEIGQVLKLITTIAQQTNLLALNATIEAARAGDAGRGFAVVANEVKELAKETAKATEDISQRIETIQVDAKGAVEAMNEIDSVIRQIHDIQTSIASAVEEQTATTQEISRSVQEAAMGIGEIAQNISGVASAAQSTSEGTQHLHRGADELANMSVQLRELLGRFRTSGSSSQSYRAAQPVRKATSTAKFKRSA